MKFLEKPWIYRRDRILLQASHLVSRQLLINTINMFTVLRDKLFYMTH